MKTNLEHESPTKIKLEVEVEASEIAPLYEATVKRLSREVNIPGFRKGKVPRAVLEQRVGKDSIREEFLRDALPEFYSRAAEEQQISPITNPDIQVSSFEEGSPLTFTAVVEIRPKIELPEYKGIKATRPKVEVSDEEIDDQLGRLRERFGSLEPVGRPASEKDYVTIDLNGYRHDEQIEQISAKDLLYEMGSGQVVPELDSELLGKRPGDILKINATLDERFGEELAGQAVSFSVIVKEVHTKKLPELDDEFAKTASEFDTLDELKDELRNRVKAHKESEAESETRGRVVEDLLDRTEIPVPDALVGAETQQRLAYLIGELERMGIGLDRYLQETGRTEQELVDSYRASSERSVAADLLLDAVAQAEDLTVTREDLTATVVDIAGRTGRTPEDVLKQVQENDQVLSLAGDILRRKALDFLMEHADITEEQ